MAWDLDDLWRFAHAWAPAARRPPRSRKLGTSSPVAAPLERVAQKWIPVLRYNALNSLDHAVQCEYAKAATPGAVYEAANWACKPQRS